jgi:hypothetical protein
MGKIVKLRGERGTLMRDWRENRYFVGKNGGKTSGGKNYPE